MVPTGILAAATPAAGLASRVGSAIGSAGSGIASGAKAAGNWIAGHPGTSAGLAAGGAGFMGGRMSKNADDTPPEGAAPVTPAPEGADAGGDPMAAMQDQLSQLAPEEFAQLLQHLTEMYKQVHGAGGGEPATSPTGDPSAPPAAPPTEPEPQPMHRNNGNIARYEREIAQLRQSHAQMQQKIANAERAQVVHGFHEELRDLDRQGWVITDKDFERVTRMSREGFEEYKEVLCEHGTRHHGNDQLIPIADEGTDREKPTDRERAALYYNRQEEKASTAAIDRTEKVTDYMRQHECTYEQADAKFDRNGRQKAG